MDTYASLKTAIADWTHRADLTSQLDDFIDITEARLNRSLRTSQQETIATLSASTEYVTLPTDFVAARSVRLNMTPVRELQYVTPTIMDSLDDNGSTLNFYTIVQDSIRLQATSSYDLEVAYYAKIPALSSSNTTNWLFTLYPDVYLYGCLAEAFKYGQDDVQAGKYNALFDDTVRQISSMDDSRKYGSSMMIRVR